jgi:hypothetical protein
MDSRSFYDKYGSWIWIVAMVLVALAAWQMV